jgi:Ferritin-like
MTADVDRAREQLASALQEAAELEHALCCLYLFAAFSLKRGIDEGLSWEQLRRVQDWAGDLLLISRQEMAHLGLVSNLLAAIGKPAPFRRPNFPRKQHSYGELPALTLERFSVGTVKRLLDFEEPEYKHLRGVLLGDIDRQGLGLTAKLRTVVQTVCKEAHWDYGEAWVRGETSAPVCVFLCHLDRYGESETRRRFRAKAQGLVGCDTAAATDEQSKDDPELCQRLLEPPAEALWKPPPDLADAATPLSAQFDEKNELFDIRTSFPVFGGGEVVAVLVFYHRGYVPESSDAVVEVVWRALNEADARQRTVGGALLARSPTMPLTPASTLAHLEPSYSEFSTIGGLYRQIRRSLQELSREDQNGGAELFVAGSSEGQAANKDIVLMFPRWFNVDLLTVDSVPAALRALDEIITEGEGTSKGDEDSHYGRLTRMLRSLEAELKNQPHFEPARNVAPNPSVACAEGTTPITHEYTKKVAALFDEVYENTLVMLMEFYARIHCSPIEQGVAEQVVGIFMPAMSMLMRPLGEMLTQMPISGTANLETAGPCFELAQNVDRRPDLDSVVTRWRVMAENSRQLASDPAAPDRLKSVAQNLARLAYNLGVAVQSH